MKKVKRALRYTLGFAALLPSFTIWSCRVCWRKIRR